MHPYIIPLRVCVCVVRGGGCFPEPSPAVQKPKEGAEEYNFNVNWLLFLKGALAMALRPG